MNQRGLESQKTGLKREMICISCPMGCHLQVELSGDGVLTVEGNKCPRGEEYGREEILAPRRVVTATVALRDGVVGRVPVKTDAPLLKEHIQELLGSIYTMELAAPVKMGEVLREDLFGTGVRLVTCRSIDKRR